MRLQFGQVSIELARARMMASWGGMLRWQPRQVSPTTGAMATPARRRLMFSYFARSAGSTSFAASARRASSAAQLLVDLGLPCVERLEPRPGRRPRARRAPPRVASIAFWISAAWAVSSSHLLATDLVRLLGDVDLAGERGVLARRPDLAEPPLPLLHLVALHPEQRLELAPLALVRLEPGLLVAPTPCGRPRPRPRSRPGGRGSASSLGLDLVHLEVDLLQLFQRLQLLTQRQGHVSSRPSLWAHQDSNLDLIGYEPTALTVELWALPPWWRAPSTIDSASSRRSS